MHAPIRQHPVSRQVYRLRRLLRREDGIAAVEFGMVAPVFLLLLIGTLDMAHMVYAKSVLNGAVQRAAREASLETGDTVAADAMVVELVSPILPGVTVASTRSSYFDFADIGRPEQFTDTNGNDTCDPGESYFDENGSGGWEEDIGETGNGGASDVVIYQVEATYKPVFQIPFMPSMWNSRTLNATAVRKNQPFGDQPEYATTPGTCT